MSDHIVKIHILVLNKINHCQDVLALQGMAKWLPHLATGNEATTIRFRELYRAHNCQTRENSSGVQ